MIPVIIVAHHTRLAMAEKLAEHLGRVHIILDTEGRGAFLSHKMALNMAAELDERVIIMEDDAIPVVDFHARAQQWFDRFPNELISFYLGTGRPPHWQPVINDILRERGDRDYIELAALLHGVCYSIPANKVRRVIERVRGTQADFAISAAWGRGTIYPVESLVEHRDGPSVEKHPDGSPRVEKRVARALAGPLMFDR